MSFVRDRIDGLDDAEVMHLQQAIQGQIDNTTVVVKAGPLRRLLKEWAEGRAYRAKVRREAVEEDSALPGWF